MKRYEIDSIIEKIIACVERHRLEKDGEYCRWTLGDNDKTVNAYGCADASNILYTVGEFPSDAKTREAHVRALQALQDRDTGLFREKTHYPMHTTAHCAAALELYDAAPLYPCREYEKYTTREGLYHLLEQEIDWRDNPWHDSHLGAGIFSCLTMTGMVGIEWKDWYFDWMWQHTDSENGFINLGDERTAPLYQYMAGGFHYIFNHEAEHRPLRYPERIVDSCIDLIHDGLSGHGELHLAENCAFIDVDVTYSLSRAMRQTPHRFEEGKRALEMLAERYIAFLGSIDADTNEEFDDLHRLFGTVCCLAELQSALPGKIITSRPLRLVLDRRPFI